MSVVKIGLEPGPCFETLNEGTSTVKVVNDKDQELLTTRECNELIYLSIGGYIFEFNQDQWGVFKNAVGDL